MNDRLIGVRLQLIAPSETDASPTQSEQTAFELAGQVQDASTLKFQFTVNNPALAGIRFDLVFGSDEFPEFVDSSYVDLAGVFVNGVNDALFNGNSKQPLSVMGTILNSAHTVKGDASFGYVADLLDNKITVAKTVAIDYGLNYNSADEAVSNGIAIAAVVTLTSVAFAIAQVGVNGFGLHFV